MRTITGLCVTGVIAMAASALAQPPGVSEKDGVWIAPDNKPLYTFARDVEAGKSACNGQCATAWPPLASADGAADDGDWTVVTRDDGTKMWAYKGKPLYTFARDTAGEPASGVSAAWPPATK